MQLSLPFTNFDKENIEYNSIHRNKATFKSGIDKIVHNWFRLTPSFGPELVKMVLTDFNYNDNSIVLDPFAGAGTTLIECQLLGLKSYGFEINPFLYFVEKTSLNWKLSLDKLKEINGSIEDHFKHQKIAFTGVSCEDLPSEFPKIHNVYRWWRKDILKDLLILKMVINDLTQEELEDYRSFFYLCIAGVLVPGLTNVTLGKLQLHFIDRADDKIDVLKIFISHLNRMIDDYGVICEIADMNKSKPYLTDSTELDRIDIRDKIDFVITSPPYPNRYSYTWNTRPFLYFFNIFSKPSEASDLDKKTIGGTWGTATSSLSKGIIEPLNSVIEENVKPVTEEIRKNDNLMANYVMKYFNLLVKQILAMDKYLASEVKIAYVVGNSRIKGVYIPADMILSNIIEN